MSDNNQTTPNQFPLQNMGDFKTVMAEKVKNIFLGFIEEDKLDAYIEEAFTSFNENEMKEMIVDEMTKILQ